MYGPTGVAEIVDAEISQLTPFTVPIAQEYVGVSNVGFELASKQADPFHVSAPGQVAVAGTEVAATSQ